MNLSPCAGPVFRVKFEGRNDEPVTMSFEFVEGGNDEPVTVFGCIRWIWWTATWTWARSGPRPVRGPRPGSRVTPPHKCRSVAAEKRAWDKVARRSRWASHLRIRQLASDDWSGLQSFEQPTQLPAMSRFVGGKFLEFHFELGKFQLLGECGVGEVIVSGLVENLERRARTVPWPAAPACNRVKL
jgi:hypothetical protein